MAVCRTYPMILNPKPLLNYNNDTDLLNSYDNDNKTSVCGVTLTKIIEQDTPSESLRSAVSLVELQCECKIINPRENVNKLSELTTNFHNVNNLKINENNFPSIDNSEINENFNLYSKEKLSDIKNQKKQIAKDWKREKTYDGSPIYRVISIFIFIFFCLNLCILYLGIIFINLKQYNFIIIISIRSCYSKWWSLYHIYHIVKVDKLFLNTTPYY